MECKLSVNVNKIALLRNARGENMPDLLATTKDIIEYGADGITIHPRPNERHITYQDAYDLKKLCDEKKIPLNIEGYPSKKFMEMVLSISPEQVTLVPDPPDAITSNNGWDVKKEKLFLKECIEKMKRQGICTSLFLDPDPKLIFDVSETGANRIELYTYEYAKQYEKDRKKALSPYLETANKATENNIGINAGHDLNLHNLNYIITNISQIQEVSIGHSLVCDALYYGLQSTIPMYKRRVVEQGLYDSLR